MKMKQYRILAGMLAAIMLTGCGDVQPGSAGGEITAQQTTVSETGTTTAETTAASEAVTTASETAMAGGAATTSKSAAGTGTTGVAESAAVTTTGITEVNSAGDNALTAADIEEIKSVVKAFMEGALKKDYEKMYDATNLNMLAEVNAKKYPSEPIPSKQEQLEEVFGSLADAEPEYNSFSVEEIESGDLDEYQDNVKYLDQLADEAKKDSDSELLNKIALVLPVLSGVEKAAEVNVNLLDPKNGSETGDVQCIFLPVLFKNGEWKVECFIADFGYSIQMSLNSKQASADTVAKNVNNAVNSALTDMDSEDYRISLIAHNKDGTPVQIAWKGADFENLKEPDPSKIDKQKDADAMMDVLKYKIHLYYSDITKIDEIRVMCKLGACMAAAVKYKGKIGLYPLTAFVEGRPVYTDIEEAFSALMEAREKKAG